MAVGTGAPCAAAMLAQKTCSPNLVILFEAGGVAPLLPQMPISVGDSRTFYRAVMAAGMAEMMTTCARGLVDYAFLGGAQIDKYGNINSTCIGDYHKPKVRFPGSGGANDFASLCWRTMIMTVHEQGPLRREVRLRHLARLPHRRRRARGGGPAGGRPLQDHHRPGRHGLRPRDPRDDDRVAAPRASTSRRCRPRPASSLACSPTCGHTEPPTAEELRILREEVDPLRLVIGRG